ncbi:MAG: electron transfer flavoprotein subunit alpha/FixB family protein [Dehalococcoidia bacterium]|nr:electron transfer flavoprotein subunit alpha/FixB family protein [Dehalococcoidia bacterium]
MDEIWVVSGTPGVGQIESYDSLLLSAAVLSQTMGAKLHNVVLAEKGAPREVPLLSSSHAETHAMAVMSNLSIETLCDSLAGMIAVQQSCLVLMSAGAWWNDLSCRLAASLGVDAITDCTGLASEDGASVILRAPIFGGRILCTSTVSEGIHVVSVRDTDEAHGAGLEQGLLDELPTSELVPSGRERVKMTNVTAIDSLLLGVEEADVVVAGGRGVKGLEGFAQLEELAKVLGGTVGGSRIAVDNRWVARERQIGQTGKTIRPKLYFACGISGSSHHVLGMKDSETVIAVNTDAGAPIFRVADAGVVGDFSEYVPALVEELGSRRKGDADV